MREKVEIALSATTRSCPVRRRRARRRGSAAPASAKRSASASPLPQGLHGRGEGARQIGHLAARRDLGMCREDRLDQRRARARQTGDEQDRVCRTVGGQPLQLRPVARQLPRGGEIGLVGVGKRLGHQAVGAARWSISASRSRRSAANFAAAKRMTRRAGAGRSGRASCAARRRATGSSASALAAVGIGAVGLRLRRGHSVARRRSSSAPDDVARRLPGLAPLGQKARILRVFLSLRGQESDRGLDLSGIGQRRRQGSAQPRAPRSDAAVRRGSAWRH
jgi:hypothetical protein